MIYWQMVCKVLGSASKTEEKRLIRCTFTSGVLWADLVGGTDGGGGVFCLVVWLAEKGDLHALSLSGLRDERARARSFPW
jgi:hypothetical protein